MGILETFFFLQALDFLTTMIGLRMGGSELSPFVRWLMQFDQMYGLAAVKMIGFLLGGFCVWSGRIRVLSWVNYVFAGIVFWNVFNIFRAMMPVVVQVAER